MAEWRFLWSLPTSLQLFCQKSCVKMINSLGCTGLHFCSGLAAAGNKSAMWPPLPPAGVRRRMGRNRQKLVGRDKGSLTEQQTEGTGTTMIQKRGIHKTKQNAQQSCSPRPLPPALPSREWVPPAPPPSEPSMMAHGLEYPDLFGQVGSAHPAVPLPGVRWKLILSWPNPGQFCTSVKSNSLRCFLNNFWIFSCFSGHIPLPFSFSQQKIQDALYLHPVGLSSYIITDQSNFSRYGCHSLNLAGNWTPHPSPSVGWGGQLEKKKKVKLMGWDENSLIGKAKAAHASKAKQGIHSLLPMDRQVFSHLQESRAPSDISYLARQKPSLWMSPPSFFSPPVYMRSMTSYGMEYPCHQLGSAVLAVSPPSFLFTPHLLIGTPVWEAEKSLTA